MTSRPEPAQGAAVTSLTDRASRTALAALAVSAAVSGAVLLLLVAVQAPRADRQQDGVRAVRLAHLAMLDQQTGLRAFLVTRQDRYLDPYRRGRDALPGADAAARRAFADDPGLTALVEENERRQRAWVDAWAVEAVGGLPEGETLTESLTRDAALFDRYREGQARLARAADRLHERSQARQVRLLGAGLALQVVVLVGAAAALRSSSRSREPVRDAPAGAPVHAASANPPPPCPPPPPSPPPADLPEPAVPHDPAPAPLPAVDTAVLHALTSRLGDRAPAFAAVLVQTWRTETHAKLDELDAAAAAGDGLAAGRCAHALKSGSAALGALRLSAYCAGLEHRLRTGEPVDLADAAARARAEVEAADAAFGTATV